MNEEFRLSIFLILPRTHDKFRAVFSPGEYGQSERWLKIMTKSTGQKLEGDCAAKGAGEQQWVTGVAGDEASGPVG